MEQENLLESWVGSYSANSDAWKNMSVEQAFLAGVQAQKSQDRKSNNKPWTKEDNELFLKMVERGCSGPQISARLCRTRTAIYARARYFGLRIVNASGDDRIGSIISDAEVEQVKRLRSRGWSRDEVARLVGISVHYVTKITSGDRR